MPTEEENAAIKARVDAAREEKKKTAQKEEDARAALAQKWGVQWPPPSRKEKYGRLSRDAKKLQHVHQLIRDVVAGKIPEPDDPHKDEARAAQPSVSTSSSTTTVQAEQDVQNTPTVEKQKAGTKVGSKHVSDDNILLFYEFMHSMNFMHETDCIQHVVNSHSDRYGTYLSASTVSGWKTRKEKIETQRAKPSEPKGPQKRGPKSRPEGFVETKQNNYKISFAYYVAIAMLILTHVTAGLPLSSSLVQPIVLGFLETKDVQWQPSTSWYRKFLKKMGLSWRAATKAARSQPHDFDKIQYSFFLRVGWLIRFYDIPKELFVNLDETGVCLLPVTKRTWAKKGSKQVTIVGKDDKRQFTVIPVITAAGTYACPAQLIWAGTGKTNGCHLKDNGKYAAWVEQTHPPSHQTTVFVHSLIQFTPRVAAPSGRINTVLNV